ncbi:MAG: hypothetical protein H5U40_04245 [Polyangiaceae bacterium]|nr:hypothetical protein [Polyangiaceae bacterium]
MTTRRLLSCAMFLVCCSSFACAPEFRRGGAGESCRARNDCSSDLACVRERCTPDGFGLSPTGSECFRVECAEKSDCCAGFVPDANCGTYETTCNDDPGQCLSYLALCVCNEECEDSLCRDRGPSCTVDDHCYSITTPICEAGHCVACRAHTDCEGADERCIENDCVRPCLEDEECPLFHRCDAGACVETGCSSDRECVYLLGDGRAKCRDRACQVGCSSDYECDVGAYEVCSGGVCVFAGCASDAECRVILDLANEPPGVTAECR